MSAVATIGGLALSALPGIISNLPLLVIGGAILTGNGGKLFDFAKGLFEGLGGESRGKAEDKVESEVKKVGVQSNGTLRADAQGTLETIAKAESHNVEGSGAYVIDNVFSDIPGLGPAVSFLTGSKTEIETDAHNISHYMAQCGFQGRGGVDATKKMEELWIESAEESGMIDATMHVTKSKELYEDTMTRFMNKLGENNIVFNTDVANRTCNIANCASSIMTKDNQEPINSENNKKQITDYLISYGAPDNEETRNKISETLDDMQGDFEKKKQYLNGKWNFESQGRKEEAIREALAKGLEEISGIGLAEPQTAIELGAQSVSPGTSADSSRAKNGKTTEDNAAKEAQEHKGEQKTHAEEKDL